MFGLSLFNPFCVPTHIVPEAIEVHRVDPVVVVNVPGWFASCWE